jgi:Phosphate-induced protein 1 conserved region
MKTKLNALASITFALALAAVAGSTVAQTGSTNTTSSGSGHTATDKSIEYHGGPVLIDSQDVYFILYGCWGTSGCSNNALSQYNDFATLEIVTDFMSTIGNTPYMQTNSTYTDSNGRPASSLLIYGGSVIDNSYAHGVALTEADIVAIIADQVYPNNRLPFDPQGIFVVLTTADIALIDGSTQVELSDCSLHGHAIIVGAPVRYVFVGNPSRRPGTCGASPNGTHTPNGNYAADQIVSWLAHALNGVLTDPYDDAWYDRYGLENAQKCEGTYGTTYTVTNPNGQSAQANIHLGVRDFLLQQNWVNGKKGHCAMTPF